MKITKSQLKRLIKEELGGLPANHYPNLENTPEKGGFQTEDGWNEAAFEEVGIMEVLNEIEKAIYEIKNGRRGSYAGIGDTEEEFLENLSSLGMHLDDACRGAIYEMNVDYDD